MASPLLGKLSVKYLILLHKFEKDYYSPWKVITYGL